MSMLKMGQLVFFLIVIAFTVEVSAVHIDRSSLVIFRDGNGPTLLQPRVGKMIVDALLTANGEQRSTTSCRLENKCVVLADDLDEIVQGLSEDGYALDEREVKNLPVGARAGTFTFYGTAVKFIEAKNLPKTSIKLRVRVYIQQTDEHTIRADVTSRSAYLEIKIKNPVPEYPLSVHKYRLMLPDEDIIELVNADPTDQDDFSHTIEALKQHAHARDEEQKLYALIETMFEQIKILAIAEPNFIKPTIGISYHRASKKFDEDYRVQMKRRGVHRAKTKTKTRSYEITIDQNLRAFYTDFAGDDHIDLTKYFDGGDNNPRLFAVYPAPARVVEFKQPDAIGYDGPGRIRTSDRMQGAQKRLWQAFVGDLSARAIEHSKPNSGKFFHVKQFLRIQNDQARPHERTILLSPNQRDQNTAQE